MANPMLGALAKLREEVEAIAKHSREEFQHIEIVLGDILRDLDVIKARLPVRKAGKVRRRAVHPKSTF